MSKHLQYEEHFLEKKLRSLQQTTNLTNKRIQKKDSTQNLYILSMKRPATQVLKHENSQTSAAPRLSFAD